MRFRYQPFRVGSPIPSLGGKTQRPRPIIHVSLVGPGGTYLDDALLDTGADDVMFPESVAAIIGVDLAKAPTRVGAGFGMHHATIRYVELTLRITDGQEQREWKGWVGFTTAQLRQPLLGYAGFLQFFTVTFHGDLEEVELTVNGSYPGT